jgi:carbamoyl-phosphate synthase large subunit
LLNVQFAIRNDTVYVLEVNPRGSRTIPFASKAVGLPLARLATRVMVGRRLAELNVAAPAVPNQVSVKKAVLPFERFPGEDTLLGPEMKSTGEVMGVGETFAEAFVKSQLAAGVRLPGSGKVFISVRNVDKPRVLEIARTLRGLGFILYATRGTAAHLAEHGIEVTAVNKVAEGRPHIVDMIKNEEIAMIVNTTDARPGSIQDSYSIRRSALQGRVTYFTTVAGARAACAGIQHMQELRVYSVQSLHRSLGHAPPAASLPA